MRPRGWVARRVLAWCAALLAILLVAGLALVASGVHQEYLRRVVESALNRQTGELFGGSIRIGQAHLDRHLALTLRDLDATLQTMSGGVPLHISALESQGPVTAYLQDGGLTLRFLGARFQRSSRQGVHGIVHVRTRPRWQLELQARVDDVGLEEFEWVNPAYLRGASGEMTGDLGLRLGAQELSFASLKMRIDEPGGRLQARFFELLLPYLPNRKEIERLAAKSSLVGFRTAHLEVSLPQSDRVRTVLRMAVPEYNIQVNLNVEVRVDEENVVEQLMRLMRLWRTP